jgi:catechol 2,3-dioxygenase-like lactoylglutathione lyase family enzyme
MHDTATTTHLDLTLDDVSAGVAFFRQVLALPVRALDGDHAEIRLGPGLVAHLRPTPGTSDRTGPNSPGPILRLQTPDVRGAIAELRRRGAQVLVEPVLTDWGTESAFVAGPDNVIIEVYRPHLA